MKKSVLVLMSLVPFAASCALMDKGPTVLSSSPESVTIRFKEGGLDDATGKANDVCRIQNRTAQLQRVTPESKEKRVAIFDCR